MPPVTNFAANPRYGQEQNNENSTKKSSSHKIIINQSKKESFNVLSGLRGVQKRLKNAWTVETWVFQATELFSHVTNTDEITDGMFEGVRAFILPHPRAKFNVSEMESIGRFLTNGGSVLVMLSEGGEQAADTNINFLLEEFGIVVNNDAVIRSIFYKYFDPKEALISNGVLNRSVAIAAKKSVSTDQQSNSQWVFTRATKNVWNEADYRFRTISFVYPYGATLSVNRLATPVLSTGSACFPIGRPVVAFHETEMSMIHTGYLQYPYSTISVLTSRQQKDDLQFVDLCTCSVINISTKKKTANCFFLFQESIMDYLLEGYELNKIDATEPELSEYLQIPDHVKLSEELKVCMQEADFDLSITSDFTKCFEQSITSFDLNVWPKVLR
ncbi:unnamed protein product [Strongylus vulgaris]|uniref:Uncharacterized protein n=1 Tax=Strongylus vulgaris TaxID=40348 RepID=A0A3P7K7Y2_STRVU|nr:unnamed protein product [Strongylus vulgaris]